MLTSAEKDKLARRAMIAYLKEGEPGLPASGDVVRAGGLTYVRVRDSAGAVLAVYRLKNPLTSTGAQQLRRMRRPPEDVIRRA